MAVERKTTSYQDQEGVVNISSRARESSADGQLLSNLAHTPFWLDGKFYESREGLWQGLYFPEGSEERARIATLFGKEAKMAGMNKPQGMTHIMYEGRLIEIGSQEHREIMRRAIHASMQNPDNPETRKALLRTEHKILTHVLRKEDGSVEPDSKSLPATIFTQMLMDEREALINTPSSSRVQ